jgi:hypothetical protein
MFYTRHKANITEQLLIVTVTISIHNATDDAEIQKLEVATFSVSEEREEESNSSETAPFTIVSKTRYGCTTGRKDGAYNLSTGTTIKWSDVVATDVDDAENLVTNYYEVLGIDENEVKVLQMHNDCDSKYINIGAGIGGGFMNTNEVHVMKYHKAINGPDSEIWKTKERKEHQRMVDSGVFDKVKRSELPSEVKIIDTTRSMKMKNSGTVRLAVSPS